MNIAYCEKWWIARKKPVNKMSEDSARQRHEKRQPYVALLGDADEPRVIVDVAGEWVSVDFLDSRQRKYLSYNFKEVQPGRLFLKSAHFWEYDGDSDSEISTKLFTFSENGHIVILDHAAASDDAREFETTASVEENWECYPRFGEFRSLCNKQRVAAG
jgi:hypothetical protein